jgi:hypothetical protein
MIGWIIFFPSFLLGIYLIVTNYAPAWLNTNMISFFPDIPFKNEGVTVTTSEGWTKIIDNYKLIGLQPVNLANTIVGILFIVSCLLVGFSREKNEDEFIDKIRLSSLLWAVLVNYLLLLFAFLFVYEIAFLNVMIYNMFTTLLIFILRFNYVLYRNSKFVSDEK